MREIETFLRKHVVREGADRQRQQVVRHRSKLHKLLHCICGVGQTSCSPSISNAVLCCSRRGTVAAWLTTVRPGSVMSLSKTLVWGRGGKFYSYSHCDQFFFLTLTENVWCCVPSTCPSYHHTNLPRLSPPNKRNKQYCDCRLIHNEIFFLQRSLPPGVSVRNYGTLRQNFESYVCVRTAKEGLVLRDPFPLSGMIRSIATRLLSDQQCVMSRYP